MREVGGPRHVQPVRVHCAPSAIREGCILRNAIRAGVGPEVIVEGMIFFHYDDHPLDGRRARHEEWDRRRLRRRPKEESIVDGGDRERDNYSQCQELNPGSPRVAPTSLELHGDRSIRHKLALDEISHPVGQLLGAAQQAEYSFRITLRHNLVFLTLVGDAAESTWFTSFDCG